jgi:hypothetical protein
VSKYCLAVAALRPDLTSNPWHRLLKHHIELGPRATLPGPPVRPSADNDLAVLHAV